MPKTTEHKSPIAIAYASSLLALATEQNQAQPIGQELDTLRQIVKDNPNFGLFLADPAIGHAERTEVLNRVFGTGTLSPLMHNFLGVANEKGRLGSLVQIADAYDQLLDEQMGKIEVDVTVAHELTPQQTEQVRSRISEALKKDAVVHQYVDDAIIGGLVIRVGDRLIDASVKTQLTALKEQLLSTR